MEAGTAESIRSSRDEKPTLSNITCLSAPVDYSDENDDDDGCGDDDNSEGEVMVIMMMMVMMMMSRMIVSHLVIPYDEP
jgi:hypothetical protein